jgi:hypothetical protein
MNRGTIQKNVIMTKMAIKFVEFSAIFNNKEVDL